MKMKKLIGSMKRVLLYVLAATMLAACTRNEIDEINNNSPQQEYIYASFEDETRVELNDNKQTVWTKDDMFIRLGDNIHDVWQFDGMTGDRGGKFHFWESFETPVDHNFNGKYFALYPYINGIYYGTGFFENGDLAMFYKVFENQDYHPNSYDTSSNIMLGIGKDAENFTFRNVMGYLRLSLTGDKKVQSIILEGNNGEILAGIRYIHQEDINIGGWYSSPVYSMTLNCGDGVQLTDQPTDFYFALTPTTFEKGISIEVVFTDGTIFPKSTSKRIAIERNTIQPMTCIATDGGAIWQSVTISHTGTDVAAPALFGYSSLTGYIYWGDNYMSEINTLISYVYQDTQESHTITIQAQGATRFTMPSCAGVSEIDLTNF